MPTRPELGWSDLRGRRVGLLGAGAEARAAVARLRTLDADVVVVDDVPERAADGLGAVLSPDAGGTDALLACDVVVKAPGVPPGHPVVQRVLAAGLPVAGGLALWLHDADPARVVCVTGTKGKSTAVTALGALLTAAGHDVAVGGNLGTPPFDPAVGEHDVWVLEVSSYQAHDVGLGPGVVGVTSLAPDHLGWHGGWDGYVRDKLSLCTRPRVRAVVAADVPGLREHDALLGPHVTWVDQPGPEHWSAAGPPGAHNRHNLAVAAGCVAALGLALPDDPAAALAHAPQLASRLELVASGDDVDVVDDGLSTNDLSAVAALEVHTGRPVALLVGGQDRGIDHAGLATAVAARRDPTLVLGLATNGPAILAALRAAGPPDHVELAEAPTSDDDPSGLRAATSRAVAWARERGGVVLLSPASPSFDHFRDYRHRGEVFTAAARAALAPGD